MGRKRLDIAGQVFNGITVLEFAEIRHGTTWWKCRCHCGREFVTEGTKLRRGHTVGCGCLQGHAQSRAYDVNNVDSQNLETCLNCPLPNCRAQCGLIKEKK